jgi:hypothetical protein
LVGAQPLRPEHVVVGVVRDRSTGRMHLSCRRFRLWRRRIFPSRAGPPRAIQARNPADRGL